MSRMISYCDICCDACGQWEPTSCTTLKEARVVMKKFHGWTVRGKQDFCKKCSKTLDDFRERQKA